MGIRGRVLFLLWIVDPFSLLLHDHLKTVIVFMYERCYEVIGTEKEYNNATDIYTVLGISSDSTDCTCCMYCIDCWYHPISHQMMMFIDPCVLHCFGLSWTLLGKYCFI